MKFQNNPNLVIRSDYFLTEAADGFIVVIFSSKSTIFFKRKELIRLLSSSITISSNLDLQSHCCIFFHLLNSLRLINYLNYTNLHISLTDCNETRHTPVIQASLSNNSIKISYLSSPTSSIVSFRKGM